MCWEIECPFERSAPVWRGAVRGDQQNPTHLPIQKLLGQKGTGHLEVPAYQALRGLGILEAFQGLEPVEHWRTAQDGQQAVTGLRDQDNQTELHVAERGLDRRQQGQAFIGERSDMDTLEAEHLLELIEKLLDTETQEHSSRVPFSGERW